MSKLEFSAQVIDSVAWPVVVLAVVCCLTRLVRTISRENPGWFNKAKKRLGKRVEKVAVRVGPFSAEAAFRDKRQKVRDTLPEAPNEMIFPPDVGGVEGHAGTAVDVAASEPMPPPIPSMEADQLLAGHLLDVAQRSPQDAVLQACWEIERRLRMVIGWHSETPADDAAGMGELARTAAHQGLISSGALRTVQALAELRDVAVQAADLLSPGQAREFVYLAGAALISMKEQPAPG